ncbi:SDR family oxidoreductase [Oceanispirochaeta crateris]|uniref:SDR family oxidoreductase n=1 Tax=Oceanispirochaeta crateris TaxID=2518645 RepID=A0A5C1QSY6_9SPIO|nr:glucose 1-dehydrogenase [Oceanispirochaeta crateris]QEN09734.1 SDR family oxidoreductase [Oceanispirochaeta crateris]
MITFNLESKTAYVTGGARGIGKTVALGLAKNGADVAIVDIDLKMATSVAEEIKAMGRRSLAISCDVTNPEDVQSMVDTIVKEWGKLDIAFNNAGICINVEAENMTPQEWKKVIDINLTGVFFTSQAAGKVMIKQKKGVIINTASMSGHIVNSPQPQCAYNASKAAVMMLTKSLAVEWAPYNVRVNSLSPGYIATEMTLSAPAEWKDRWIDLTPVKRMGTPKELVSAILYLADDSASFTTGTDLVVDGGFTSI